MGQNNLSNLTDNQWNNLNTEDNSSASYVNKAVNSVDKLNDIFAKYKSTPIQANYNTTTSINDSAQSETSPFISSEMYNYLVNKNQPNDNIQKEVVKLLNHLRLAHLHLHITYVIVNLVEIKQKITKQ